MPRDTPEERQARLAAALRQNLRRRKAQERQRTRTEGDEEMDREGKSSAPPPPGKEPSNAG